VSMACGTTLGVYSTTSVDAGSPFSLGHEQIVAGLLPSTTYYCQISATNIAGTQTSVFAAITQGSPASTPITGLSFSSGTAYNSINSNNYGCCDTFYNAVSNDGTNYFTNDDTFGFQQNGQPARITNQSGITLGKFTSTNPVAGILINAMSAYGSSGGQPPDNLSQKDSGLFAMNGGLYMSLGRQHNTGTDGGSPSPAYTQVDGQVIASYDHGQSWNNFQEPGVFLPNGNPTNPANAAMFGSTPSDFASMAFVMYGADDGTLGYFSSDTQQDNANAYVYGIANEGTWNGGGTQGGGNAFYLTRVPRAKMRNLNPADYSFYTGGDGSLDASWSHLQTTAVAIISNYGSLGEPAVDWIPALHRYLLLTYYYPNGANTSAAPTVWLGYEAPHPWGPWTLINSTTWSQGYYNPIPIEATKLTGTTPTIMFTDDFFTGYNAFIGTMNILH
jgi:hypothetical protein